MMATAPANTSPNLSAIEGRKFANQFGNKYGAKYGSWQMPSFLKTRYSPSGLLFFVTFVLAAISVAALVWPVLRLVWLGVLLLAVAFMMVDAWFLWRAQVHTVEFSTSHHPVVRQAVTLSLWLASDAMSNQSLTATLIPVEHDIFSWVDPVPVVEYDAHRHMTRVNIKLMPKERGRWWWPGMYVRFHSPIGLFQAYKPIDPILLSVYPSMMQSSQAVLDPKMLLQQSGVRVSRRHKADQEFESLRPYQSGDEYRHIDWKASARMHHLITRQFQVAHHHQILVCVDTSRMMSTQSEGVRKIDWAIEATLHLGHLARRFEDRMGVVVFDDGIHQFASPRQTTMAFLLQQLYDLNCSISEPNYPLLCSAILRAQRKRSLVIILSDFMDANSLEPSLDAFAQLNRRHCTLFIGVDDPVYTQYLHPAQLDSADEAVKYYLAQETKNRREMALQQLRHYGLHAITATPSTLSHEATKAYTLIKNQGFIG